MAQDLHDEPDGAGDGGRTGDGARARGSALSWPGWLPPERAGRLGWALLAGALVLWQLDLALAEVARPDPLYLTHWRGLAAPAPVAAYLLHVRRPARWRALGVLAASAATLSVAGGGAPPVGAAGALLGLLVVVGLVDALAAAADTPVRGVGDVDAPAAEGHDALTGLVGRRALPAALAEREDCWAVLLVDVDHLSVVNELHGRAAGDDVLRGVAAATARAVGPGAVTSRWDGAQLLVAVTAPAPPTPAGLAEAVRAGVAAAELTPPVTTSVGVGVVQPGEPWQTAIGRADTALYAAKRRGRDRVVTEHDVRQADAVAADQRPQDG